jgi:hypothetical protein
MLVDDVDRAIARVEGLLHEGQHHIAFVGAAVKERTHMAATAK